MLRTMFCLLVFAAVLPAQPRCSTWSVSGTYAVTYEGWALIPQPGGPPPQTLPGVILGVVSLANDGTVSGSETVVVAGTVMEYEITGGKLSLNADCTGSLKTQIRPKGATGPSNEIVERIIVLPDEKEMRSIIVASPGAPVGSMGIGYFKRIAYVPNAVSW